MSYPGGFACNGRMLSTYALAIPTLTRSSRHNPYIIFILGTSPEGQAAIGTRKMLSPILLASLVMLVSTASLPALPPASPLTDLGTLLVIPLHNASSRVNDTLTSHLISTAGSSSLGTRYPPRVPRSSLRLSLFTHGSPLCYVHSGSATGRPSFRSPVRQDLSDVQ